MVQSAAEVKRGQRSVSVNSMVGLHEPGAHCHADLGWKCWIARSQAKRRAAPMRQLHAVAMITGRRVRCRRLDVEAVPVAWGMMLRGSGGARGLREALTVCDPDNPVRYFAVRGRVLTVTADGAADHIEKLAQRYLGGSYPWYGGRGQRRLLITIAADKISGGR
jgi:hypothetical protein